MVLTRIALLVLLLGGLACAPKPPPEKAVDSLDACCTECSDGASTDPQGQDLSLLDCARYTRTDVCRVWFQEHPTFVQDCRGRG